MTTDLSSLGPKPALKLEYAGLHVSTTPPFHCCVAGSNGYCEHYNVGINGSVVACFEHNSKAVECNKYLLLCACMVRWEIFHLDLGWKRTYCGIGCNDNFP